MGRHSIHYGFVAEEVLSEIGGDIRYVENLGWCVWNGRFWQRRPKEWGIVGIIHEVMKTENKYVEGGHRGGSGRGGFCGVAGKAGKEYKRSCMAQ